MHKLPAEALGRWAAAILCLWFLAAGLVLLPYPGVQNDEALFGAGIYPPYALQHWVSVFKHQVPTMLMTYIGALKIWLYAGIFRLWEPSVWSVRAPVLLLGTLTIWMAWRLMRRTLGLRAGLVGTALLATDASYLMTSVFDWGPVVLQHVFLTGGCLALARYRESDRMGDLALGFLCFGLGMWDKAIFVWTLGGLSVATLVVFPRELLKRLNWKTVAVAALAFSLGAYPLIRFNVKHRLATFEGNACYTSEDLLHKAYVFRATLQGAALFGYLAPNTPTDPPGEPRNAIERASVAVDRVTGGQWRSWMYAASLAALALVSFAGRAGWFAVVFCAVVWAQMAFNKDTGGGAHHVVLMWPFPQVLIAAALTGTAARLGKAAGVLVALVTAVLCVCNALVVNHCAAAFVRGNTTPIWTDAISPLTKRLEREAGRKIYVLDWGMMDALRLLGRGRLNLFVGSDPFKDADVTAADRQTARHMLADPDAVFVAHTPDKYVFQGVWERFNKVVAEEGLTVERVETVADGAGRPVFQIFRVRRAGQTVM